MKIIDANSSATLVLGRCGENLARQVVFDVKDFESIYGVGTVEVLYQRPKDAQPYPLAVQRDGASITWNVTSTDTAIPSEFGKCELRYYSGDTLVKSKIWQTWVENALSTSSETIPPEPEQGWVDQVLDAKQTAEKAAVDVKANADRAAVLAAEVAQNASQVAQNVSYTNEAKEAAALSASEAAQSAQEAEGSASVASTSETNAKASEVSAKAAQKAATESANAAANSAELASEYASAAAKSASAAQQSATSAAESAAVYDDVVADVNQLKQDITAITPDDAAVNGKPWTSKKIVDTICQPFEENGNPVQVYPVENYPLGVKVQIEPMQEGSGDPSPDNIRPITGRDAVQVTRCGKNLLPFGERLENIYTQRIMAPDALLPLSKAYAEKKLTLTFTVETQDIVFNDNVEEERRKRIGFECKGTLADGKTVYELQCWINNTNGELTKNGKKTVTATATMPKLVDGVITFHAQNIKSGSFVAYDFGIYAGTTTATPYEPYTGSTTDIALPETVYGGTLDVETGVVTVRNRVLIPDGTTIKFSELNEKYWNLPYGLANGGAPSVVGVDIICSHYYGRFGLNASNGVLFTRKDVMADLYETVDDFNTYVANQYASGTPLQLMYTLAEPYTIQLTPQQIAALSGVNTIYTDADSVVVTGAEDPKHTITELKNAIISLGGNV